VGQKQVTIDYLEKIIDLAKEELSIDIKKIQFSAISWFKENIQKVVFSVNQLY
jgi:hypothetical protein